MALTTKEGQVEKTVLSMDEAGEIAKKMLVHLDGLNKKSVDLVLEWIQADVNSNYFLSIPIKALN